MYGKLFYVDHIVHNVVGLPSNRFKLGFIIGTVFLLLMTGWKHY